MKTSTISRPHAPPPTIHRRRGLSLDFLAPAGLRPWTAATRRDAATCWGVKAAFIAFCSLILPAPTAEAAKGGKPGGGGGGGTPPPAPAAYSVIPIPRPSWASGHSVAGLNNQADVIGETWLNSSGKYPTLDTGFVWYRETNSIRRLPPLPGDVQSQPLGLSDARPGVAPLVLGSSIPSQPTRYNPTVVVWRDTGGTTPLVINIEPMLVDYATENLPAWFPPGGAWEAEGFVVYHGANRHRPHLSQSGRYIITWAPAPSPFPSTSNNYGVAVLARLDWNLTTPNVTGMWVLGAFPPSGGDVVGNPEPQGYLSSEVLSICEGASGQTPVVRMAGSLRTVSPEGTSLSGSRPVIWEFNEETEILTFKRVGFSRRAMDVNPSGDSVGWDQTASDALLGYYWPAERVYSDSSPTGMPIPGLPGTIGDQLVLAYALNSDSKVVGAAWPPNQAARVAALWSPVAAHAVDLNTLTGVNLSLNEAIDINENGEILAAQYGQKRTDKNYLLVPNAAP